MSIAAPSRVTCEAPGCGLPSAYLIPVDGRLERRCIYDSGLFAWDETCNRCGIRNGTDCDLCGGKGFVLLPHQAPAGPVTPPVPGRQAQTRRCGDAELPESVAAPDTQTKGTQNASTDNYRTGLPDSPGRMVAADPVPPRHTTRGSDPIGRGNPGIPATDPPQRSGVNPTDPWFELACWIAFFLIIACIAAWLADRH